MGCLASPHWGRSVIQVWEEPVSQCWEEWGVQLRSKSRGLLSPPMGLGWPRVNLVTAKPELAGLGISMPVRMPSKGVHQMGSSHANTGQAVGQPQRELTNMSGKVGKGHHRQLCKLGSPTHNKVL